MPLEYYLKQFVALVGEVEGDGYGVAFDVFNRGASLVLFSPANGEEVSVLHFNDTNPYGHHHG